MAVKKNNRGPGSGTCRLLEISTQPFGRDRQDGEWRESARALILCGEHAMMPANINRITRPDFFIEYLPLAFVRLEPRCRMWIAGPVRRRSYSNSARAAQLH